MLDEYLLLTVKNLAVTMREGTYGFLGRGNLAGGVRCTHGGAVPASSRRENNSYIQSVKRMRKDES